jgi:hypothetical protein
MSFHLLALAPRASVLFLARTKACFGRFSGERKEVLDKGPAIGFSLCPLIQRPGFTT